MIDERFDMRLVFGSVAEASRYVSALASLFFGASTKITALTASAPREDLAAEEIADRLALSRPLVNATGRSPRAPLELVNRRAQSVLRRHHTSRIVPTTRALSATLKLGQLPPHRVLGLHVEHGKHVSPGARAC